MAIYPNPSAQNRLRTLASQIIGGSAYTDAPLTPVTGAGGLHHISCGMGDPGVSVTPQTLHTIEMGISA
jgi:hypothetical protein